MLNLSVPHSDLNSQEVPLFGKHISFAKPGPRDHLSNMSSCKINLLAFLCISYIPFSLGRLTHHSTRFSYLTSFPAFAFHITMIKSRNVWHIEQACPPRSQQTLLSCCSQHALVSLTRSSPPETTLVATDCRSLAGELPRQMQPLLAHVVVHPACQLVHYESTLETHVDSCTAKSVSARQRGHFCHSLFLSSKSQRCFGLSHQISRWDKVRIREAHSFSGPNVLVIQQDPICLGPSMKVSSKQICILLRHHHSESDSVFRPAPVCLVVSLVVCSLLHCSYCILVH